MPIYEYQCDGCEAVFEVYQKVSDPAPSAHSCGSDKVHRILSNTSFVLKGTGWYATDYADKSKKTDESHSGKAHKKHDAQNASSAGDGKSSGAGSSKAEGASKSLDASKSASDKPSGKGSAQA